jgi:hypothetical protein
MDKARSDSKKKKPIEQVAERLAEILYMQIEWNRKNRKKKYGKEKIR